jgi:hypothetical protein
MLWRNKKDKQPPIQGHAAVDHISDGRSAFKTVDFKFINEGSAASFCTGVSVIVEDVVINRLPELRAYSKVNDGCLDIFVANSGWGSAQLSDIHLQGASASLLSDVNPTTNRISILAGEEQRIFHASLSSSSIAMSLRNSLADQRSKIKDTILNNMKGGGRNPLDGGLSIALSSYEEWHIQEFFADSASGSASSDSRQRWHVDYISEIPLNCLPVHIDAIKFEEVDEYGGARESELPLASESRIWFSEQGFFTEPPNHIMACMRVPTLRMIAFIDPEKFPSKKLYRMSAITQAGGGERFQITLTADKSCAAKVCFEFHFDGKQVVRSSLFEVSIWRPKGSSVQGHDGSQFVPSSEGWRLADDSGAVTKTGWR